MKPAPALPVTDDDDMTLAPLIHALEQRVLGALLHREYADPGHAHYYAQVGHDEDAVMIAAGALVRAVDELPPEDRPIGWDDYTYGYNTPQATT